jgi:TonB family protein
MNRMARLSPAAIVVLATARLTPRPPVASPAQFAEGTAEAKVSPVDASTARTPMPSTPLCAERAGEVNVPPSAVTISTADAGGAAREWMNATFYNRVAVRVRDQWHPADAYRSHDRDGGLPVGPTLTTRLKVYLRADGSLERIDIECSSGLQLLDNAAVEAFGKAQPFLHPPRNLVTAGGQVIFGFGFVFNTTRGSEVVGDARP